MAFTVIPPPVLINYNLFIMNDADVLAGLNQNINNMANILAASAMQEDAQHFNSAMQEDAQSWQLALWELQNKYNLPSEQIQRFLAAGVNPALVYGRGVTSPAAPVPNSPMASSGITHVPALQNSVLASKQAELIDSQVDVNKSVEAKNEADAAASREQADLTHNQATIAGVQASLMEQLKGVLAENQTINNELLKIKRSLGLNAVERDDIYTETYSTLNSLEIQRLDLNNKNLAREYQLLGAQINLAVANKKLTEAQANHVAILAQIAAARRYIAQWESNFARAYNEAVYGSSDSPNSGSAAFQDVVSTAKKNIANSLSKAILDEKYLSNEYGFEVDYGASYRYYQYEDLRRGANKKRADIWYGAISTFGSLAVDAYTAGSAGAYRRAAGAALRQTNHQFGYYNNSDIQPNTDFYHF